MRLPLHLKTRYMFIITHEQIMWHTRSHHDSSKVDHKGHKVGGGSIPENPHPFPQITEILLYLLHACSVTSVDPMNCSMPSSSVHEIPQARVLEWVAIPFFRVFSQPSYPPLHVDPLPFEQPGKLPLIGLWNYSHPWKLTTLYPGATLTFWDGPYSYLWNAFVS